MKILFALLILTLDFQVCFGQKNYEISLENQSYKNLKIHHGQDLYIYIDLYSKNELINFSEKLNSFTNSKFSNWEGGFSGLMSETSFSTLIWNKEIGYVSFNVDTCRPDLRLIDYGNIKETDSTVEFIPQTDTNSIRKNVKPTKYVKVNWTPRKYLVEESSVLAFAENAAGIYIESENTDSEAYMKWTNFWEGSNSEKPLLGLPVFPKEYKKLERKAIETKIRFVGKRTIEKDKSLGNTTYSESAFYQITLTGGSDLGIKEGMEFYCPVIQDFIYITKVNPNYSEGLIEVDIDENKRDSCFSDENKSIKCPKIKADLFVTTKKQTSDFF